MAPEHRFKRQYKPVNFGDPPDPRTVDGTRIAAQQRAETRRLNRIQKDHEEGQDQNVWLAL